jgi:Amt family ammonium transporter
VLGAVMPLRATDAEQAIGMDVVQHGEEAYATGEGALLLLPDGHERERGIPVADVR